MFHRVDAIRDRISHYLQGRNTVAHNVAESSRTLRQMTLTCDLDVRTRPRI